MVDSQKVLKGVFSSFRQKPESSHFSKLQTPWTPAFAGVTTFCETINNHRFRKDSISKAVPPMENNPRFVPIIRKNVGSVTSCRNS
jgi:hypothetical protein